MKFIIKFARAGWRPAACWAIVAAIVVQAVIIPLMTHPVDLTALGALVMALAPFVAARTYEKHKGCA